MGRTAGAYAAGTAVETGPALFAGTVCVLFGALLVLWTVARTRKGEPVVATARPRVAALLTTAFGVAFLLCGVWLLRQL